MRPNLAKQKFIAGAPIVNAWLSIPSGYAAEVVASQGFDSVTVDMQHGMMGFDSAVVMLQAVSITSATPLVRCPSLNAPEIMRLLDAGAYGVICPAIDTPEMAQEFVAACRYPGAGTRSFGPARGLLYGGPDYFAHANETIIALAMIESRRALNNLDAILDTAGLDGVYIGPNDLALSLGVTPSAQPAEEVERAIERIVAAVRHRGLIAGIFCSDGDAARRRVEQGFHLVTPGNDANALASASASRLVAARGAKAVSAGSGY
ncbi:HpcH/HpaI aldolase family protein [Burkholderia pseudomultivorans]|uniref:2,4-dihydroxyhept-2-ene-1,7-dioic acid aldolase n=1 Tax=Burkholderia pseudomultivorans TaxID=1207504 RepID=A0A132EC99_9BURK|nr:aldolase/citrate lyase family protein [Burkholderia pseudomultivorans]KWF23278.1 2,4-dihydroxyhept-2-ene-1,7-dioic acid aldolase [Burkholderia pseudomultivorans]